MSSDMRDRTAALQAPTVRKLEQLLGYFLGLDVTAENLLFRDSILESRSRENRSAQFAHKPFARLRQRR